MYAKIYMDKYNTMNIMSDFIQSLIDLRICTLDKIGVDKIFQWDFLQENPPSIFPGNINRK